MRQSSAGRALMDAALVRLALAEQFAPIGDVLANLDSAGASPSSPSSPPRDQKKKPEDTGLRSPPPRPAPPVAPAPVTKAPAPAQPAEDDDLPRPGKVWDNSGPSAADLLRQHLASQAPQSTPTPPPAAKTTSEQPSAPAAPASNVEPVDPADLPAVQRAFLEVLATRGPALHALLAAGEYTGIRENQAVIRYPAQHATFLRILEKNGKKDQIKLVMSQVVGRDVGVKFEVEPPPAAEADASGVAEPAGQPKPASRPANRPQQPAPAARAAPVAPPPPAARPTAEQIEALKASDGLVRALVDELGAQVLRIE
jgi:hypothetical protein